MTDSLLKAWQALNTALSQQHNDGVQLLLALRSFRATLDQYFLSTGQSGSAADLLEAISTLQTSAPLPKSQALQHKLANLAQAMSRYDKALFTRHHAAWQVINGDYNPVQSLLIRLVSTMTSKGERPTQSQQEVAIENYQEIAAFGNIIFQADLTTARKQIKTTNTAIKLFIQDPNPKNSTLVAEQLSTLWFIETQSNAAMHVLKHNNELCKKTCALYSKFLLTVCKQSQQQTNQFPPLPENFRKFHVKQQSLTLIRKEQARFFQHSSNQRALKQIEQHIQTATNINELRSGLNQLKLYSSFQTIHPLLRLIKRIFNCNNTFVENITLLQNMTQN